MSESPLDLRSWHRKSRTFAPDVSIHSFLNEMDDITERRVNTLLSHVTPRVACVISAHAVEEFTDQRVGELCASTCSATERPGGDNIPEHMRLLNIDGFGLNGNMWYPVAVSSMFRPQDVREAIFWGSSICIWRGKDGVVNAIEDRCAHRQLRLSKGTVDGDNVTCCYHGWEYDGKGKVVKLAHEIPKSFKTLPDIRVRSYPAKEVHGLVWIFMGDPTLANSVPVAPIPWLDSKQSGYMTRFADMTVNANFMDVFHNASKLSNAREFKYSETTAGPTIASGSCKITFRYPTIEIQRDSEFTEYIFAVPIDVSQTRLFALMIWKPKSVAGIAVPSTLAGPLQGYSYRQALHDFVTFCKSLTTGSKAVVINDQEASFNRAVADQIPAEWSKYLQTEQQRQASIRKSEWKLTHGAGLGYQQWATFQ